MRMVVVQQQHHQQMMVIIVKNHHVNEIMMLNEERQQQVKIVIVVVVHNDQVVIVIVEIVIIIVVVLVIVVIMITVMIIIGVVIINQVVMIVDDHVHLSHVHHIRIVVIERRRLRQVEVIKENDDHVQLIVNIDHQGMRKNHHVISHDQKRNIHEVNEGNVIVVIVIQHQLLHPLGVEDKLIKIEVE